jgi:hypothetical protein
LFKTSILSKTVEFVCSETVAAVELVSDEFAVIEFVVVEFAVA